MKISENIKTSFFTVLFIFLFLFLYTKTLGPIPFSVNSTQTSRTDLFTVQGTGEVKATAGKASFSLGVTKTAPTAEEAKNQINEVSNKIVADLKTLGIPESAIKTSNFSVNPDYSERPITLVIPNGKPEDQKATSYTANQTIDVKTDTVDLANQAIDLATKDGANVTNNVQFVFDDATQEKLENEARQQAITKAKEKAQKISSMAGIKLGKLVNLTEDNFGNPVAFSALKSADTTEPPVQTQLNPGENTIRVTVTLSYETL